MNFGGWDVEDLGGEVHVVPKGDLRAHRLDTTCWCRPVEDDEEPSVKIHNALDQRELYEKGRKTS